MPNTLRDRDWEMLLQRIDSGKCTPFLGAGACTGTLPLGSEIAKEWAKEKDYPFPDCSDLVRVAQYLAKEYDSIYPKEEIIKLIEKTIKEKGLPDLLGKNQPHSVLADLPLPIYMTTNYDNIMTRALIARQKNPHEELCPWNASLQKEKSDSESDIIYNADSQSPIVYHLHGNSSEIASIVLTEDDYLDFLLNIARDETLIHPRIQAALTNASLLFVGYNLSDWSFRVIFRGLVVPKEESQRYQNISVQLPPLSSKDPKVQENALNYLNKYFGRFKIRVYWGTAQEFMTELRQRWEDYKNAG